MILPVWLSGMSYLRARRSDLNFVYQHIARKVSEYMDNYIEVHDLGAVTHPRLTSNLNWGHDG